MSNDQSTFTANMDTLIQRLNAHGGMRDVAESMGTQRTETSGWIEHGSWRIPAGKPFNPDQAYTTLVEQLGGHSEQ